MAVRSLKIDPSIDPDLMESVRKAETKLEQYLGEAAGRVEVVWKPGNLDATLKPTATLELTESNAGGSTKVWPAPKGCERVQNPRPTFRLRRHSERSTRRHAGRLGNAHRREQEVERTTSSRA